ncbi:MAG: hypothetical protein E7424_06460 [Ruminococcaceae bacterium]|jgi:hypothetical protein|nr:hypothetical protein [Oscillospiraceae bacterium]
MAYTALSKMSEENKKRFGKDVGPAIPEKHFNEDGFDFKSAVLRFLHNRCENLQFDAGKTKEEDDNNILLGKSMKEHQIPFNMQMDINRLCLERELERFIDSGVAEDAYTVYFCYMEMFFGDYSSSKKRVELLSEFETNGSSLLMKHRDHYSHTVYVFSLGLAIYETNAYFRKKFKEYYNFDTDESNTAEDHMAAHFFLEYWGLTSLFHDIGYPFEIPFEEVCSYYEVDNIKRKRNSVHIVYHNVNQLTKIPVKMREHLETLYGQKFTDTNKLFAHDIFNKLGVAYDINESALCNIIKCKPTKPDKYGLYMDHAWFSANLLFQKLLSFWDQGIEDRHYPIKREHIDALTAILLHNSIFKFSIAFYKKKDETGARKTPNSPLKITQHPLAYLLMLCDELQCWDRASYGRNTRQEAHPFNAEFDFSKGQINAIYVYDTDEWEKIDQYKDKYIGYLQKCLAHFPDPEKPELKSFSKMYENEQSFLEEIHKIVEIDKNNLTVSIKMAPVDRSVKHTYLSVSNFLHLYDFAVVLNARYNYNGKEDTVNTKKLEEEFETLSLEYQLSNINQAKSFSKYLNAIGCFYTDRPVSYRILDHFEESQTAVFAPMEHKRWVLEHQWMGWKNGDLYLDKEALTIIDRSFSGKDLREQLRMHKLAMDGNLSDSDIKKHYYTLTDEDKGKDWKPFNSMLKLIKKYDGLRIYQLD